MKIGDRIISIIVPIIASLVMRILHLTLRNEIIGDKKVRDVKETGKHIILCFWHDQLFLMVFGLLEKKSKLLISSSHDGELLARTMEYFGQDAVRGSSSRGGSTAFRQMIKFKHDIALAPDGPRGPRHELKDGVVQLARLSGRPVIPMAFICSRGHRFKSWDRFLMPYPFCRGVYSYGEPLYFNKHQENVDEFRQRLLKAMEDNQQQAETHLESYGVSAV